MGDNKHDHELYLHGGGVSTLCTVSALTGDDQ
jgi:hypothetical protein